MIISSRARALIQSPQYGKVFPDKTSAFYQWKISSDKKLTVSYEATIDTVRIPLMETISLFINHKELNNLFTLEFREVENFLRDQNDTPAFSSNVEDIYRDLLSALTFSFFKFQQISMQLPQSFIDENHFWMQVFKPLLGVEFVLKNQDTLYFFNKRSDSIVSFVI